MRTPSRWFTRRAHHLFPLSPPSIARVQQTSLHVRPIFTIPPSSPCQLNARHASHTARPSHIDDALSNAIVKRAETLTPEAIIASRDVRRIEKLSRWMSRLNKLLPTEYRIVEQGTTVHHDDAEASLRFNPQRLLEIIKLAKDESGADVLLWLVDNGYRRTAVWLMEDILSHYSSRKTTTSLLSTPSNINWPNNIFTSIRRSPVGSRLNVSRSADGRVLDEGCFAPAKSENVAAGHESRLIGHVWETLGVLIINSSQASKSDTMDDNMLSALLVLAHVHRLGMMPDNVYAYDHQDRPTHAQRPPILHLVSSRILAALSDVTWRQQQDDAISQATREGMSLREISKNVPGGRFRLKVQPLAPEIWLELILWGCIESDQIGPAVAIVSKLAAQAEEPWFAVRWSTTQSREKVSTLTDWDRASRRHGGTSGLIEGYSRDKPFVNVPDKTVSVEVILALIEKLLASVVSGSLVNTVNVSNKRASSVHKDFRDLGKTMSDIQDVMKFLEPHDLGPDYFDYLESRLLQDKVFDLNRAPVDLYTWTTQMRSIRALEQVDSGRRVEASLRLDDIYAQSQLHVGVQHQAFTSLVEFGDLHNTLAVFNEIQESIDEKKVTSIKSFLQQQQQPYGQESAIVAKAPILSSKHDLEFTNSHGQLPYYKLAGLLNLISDTNLIGLGRWLLYAEEVDGAAVPEQVWGLPCMTSALYKFAAVSQDEDLIKAAAASTPRATLPSVKSLRTLVDANLNLLHLYRAIKILEALKPAAGGGYGLSNVANLAAMILRLEHGEQNENQARSYASQLKATRLLKDILVTDRYNTSRGDYTLEARHLFKQQISLILTVLSFFGDSTLGKVSSLYSHRFPPSNLPLLPARVFNVLLSAGIDAYGAEFGRQMWRRFCKSVDSPFDLELFQDDAESVNSMLALVGHDELDVFAEPDSATTSGVSLSANSEDFQQNSHDNAEEDPIEFDDPFFPKQRPTSIREFEITAGSLEADGPAQAQPQHSAVVLPNLNTLRLIVRAAVREVNSQEKGKSQHQGSKRILAWAWQIFKAFGITDRTVIEQEIQHPLDEIDVEMIQKAREAIEADKERAEQWTMEQDSTADEPVSEVWAPPVVDRKQLLASS